MANGVGSAEHPVVLDIFQTIKEVHWSNDLIGVLTVEYPTDPAKGWPHFFVRITGGGPANDKLVGAETVPAADDIPYEQTEGLDGSPLFKDLDAGGEPGDPES